MTTIAWKEIAERVLTDPQNWKEVGGRKWLVVSRAIESVRELDPKYSDVRDATIRSKLQTYARKTGMRESGKGITATASTGTTVTVVEEASVEVILKPFIVTDGPKDYIPQQFPGGSDIDLLTKAFNTKRHTLIEGISGVGKSTAVWQVLASAKSPAWRVSAHERLDFEDLVGRWIPYNSGWRFIKGPVYVAVKYGMPLIIEEINMTQPSLLSFLNSATDDTREVTVSHKAQDGSDVSEVVKVHPNFWLVGTMNRGYAGTRPLNAAFARRFSVKLEYGHALEAEQKLLPKWINDVASKLRGKAEIIRTPVSIGVLKALRDNVETFGKASALWMFLNGFAPEERREVAELIFLLTNEQVSYQQPGGA